MTRPVVTVVVPTRNRAHCLPTALDSIHAQEGLGEQFDIETIVVDDASSDATPSVVNGFPGVRYIRQESRRGVSAALNEGLRACTGRYITFLGDDDEWLPHKLRVQIPLLAAHPGVGVVYGQALVRMRDRELVYPEPGRAPSGWVFREMLMENFCGHHAAVLARREAFDKAGEFDESLVICEDFDMSLRIAQHFPFLFSPGVVTIYNLSLSGSYLTRVASGQAGDDAARVIEKGLQMLPDSEDASVLSRQARARGALEAASSFVLIGDVARSRDAMLAALRSYPWAVRHEWGRRHVRAIAHERVRNGESPVTAVRDLLSQIRSAAIPSRVAGRWWKRRLLAELWLDAARASVENGRVSLSSFLSRLFRVPLTR